ncbi:MAG: non-ribosomal peptide synthetase [Candidatus Acidiferrales bacterium]
MDCRPPDSVTGLSQNGDAERRLTLRAIDAARCQSMLVPEWFAAQAAITPNEPAIVDRSNVLTYGELCGRANRIGRLLSSYGVGPDTLVAVCMERSALMVVANLGVLMSGAAYVPLDPSYPQERLEFMLNDARPTLLLTQNHLAKRLPMGKWRTINLVADVQEILRHSAEWSDSGLRGENLAYVIYTSGSTGHPKAVQIAHQSLSNLVRWHQRAFSVQPSDRATQLASPSFDAAVWEVWPYLTAGASVHVADEANRSDPVALRDWLVRQRITITFVPTPMAERMIVLEWPGDAALRVLLTGADTLRRYPRAGLPFAVINNYGPTECTVVATSGSVPSNEHPDNLPSIGRPISNTEIYILNEEMQQVPIGVIGEIYIGGAGIARGYLNRPKLTRERFVPNPFICDPKARLYKTGDLGRYLPDGQIAFVGRIDDQLKIRGYRIEPNEIVSALNEHPAVLNSTVTAREGSAGDKYLIGYLVFNSESQSTASELQDFLRHRLPAHAIPSVFVRLESLPLTASGKVDRASLPAPNATNTIVDAARTAPRSLIEQGVSCILAKLLDVKEIGVNDNFFLLGGHSLLAAQLIGSVRDIFGVEFPLRTIFDSPTVAELSDQIEKSLSDRVDAMTPEEVRQALAESQAQG